MFDVKTRAATPIRLDLLNFEVGLFYSGFDRTGLCDLHTRSLRIQTLNCDQADGVCWMQENSGYLIRTLHGPLESFEKEYYDLIRSAFLKYRCVRVPS